MPGVLSKIQSSSRISGEDTPTHISYFEDAVQQQKY